jgi:hypothetical protein
MDYIDIFIPLIIGFVCVAIPDKFTKSKDAATQAKTKSLITKVGYVLIAVSVVYFVIKIIG